MRRKSTGPHGNVPDKSEVVLLLIDVINPLDFPEASQILRYIPAMAKNLAALKARAQRAGVPAIYVNDNFGRWRSDFRAQVDYCLGPKSQGLELVRHLQPGAEDYFVLKPKHSGFFASTLETLLRYLGARRLIITGVAGNFCVLFTANDAYMRDFQLVVPRDCTASNTRKENEEALRLMKNYLKADTRRSSSISFGRGSEVKKPQRCRK